MARTTPAFLYFCLGLMLVGCGTTRIEPAPGEPVVIVRDCTPDVDADLFRKFEVPGMEDVRAEGATNRALLVVFKRQENLLVSANLVLSELEALYRDAKRRCERSE